MIIAIDGPAASGKGTLAKLLANHYGFFHLDTGMLYRAVAHEILTREGSPDDPEIAVDAANRVESIQLDDERLRAERVGVAASKVAAIPEVREQLLEYQRNFAENRENAILDGRDIGTVVCPNADIKLFLTASEQDRAERRCEELRLKGVATNINEMLIEIRDRDQRDSNRLTAPLKKAEDAYLINTSGMDILSVFKKAVKIIDLKRSTC